MLQNIQLLEYLNQNVAVPEFLFKIAAVENVPVHGRGQGKCFMKALVVTCSVQECDKIDHIHYKSGHNKILIEN
jgi:hypothetical protein